MDQNTAPQLLAIVEVSPAGRVLCGQPGCGHSVWKAIHVVRDGTELLVLGSTCFEKRYGNGHSLGVPHYGGGGESRKLTSQECQLLAENTAELLARFKEEERVCAQALALAQAEATATATAAAAARLAAFVRPVPSRVPRTADIFVFNSVKPPPCPWMKPATSLGYFKLRDGSGWVRVQRKDGQQILVPWPAADGWDEALPAHIGLADLEHGGYVVADLRTAVEYLRKVGDWDRVFGSWKELTSQVRT
jgi:hypothetical protein